MTEHTPTPWGFITTDEGRYCGLVNSRERTVFVADGNDWEEPFLSGLSDEDAAFLLRCVNSHDALVKALEDMTELYANLINSGDCGFWNPEEKLQVIAARAALAAAKEEMEG